MTDQPLWNALARALEALEASGEIVVCRPVSNVAVQSLHDAILDVVPDSNLTATELSGVRALILHAIRDKQFFNWEKPTVTGFTAEQFEAIAKRLPKV